MFATAARNRSATLHGLLVSVIVHALTVMVFWQSRAFPKRFSSVQVVYAATPVWLPQTEPVDTHPGTPGMERSELPGSTAIPPAVSEASSAPAASIEDTSALDNVVIPREIDSLLQAGLLDSVPQQTGSFRLGDIPRFGGESADAAAAAPPPEFAGEVPKDAPKDVPKNNPNAIRVEPARLVKETIPSYPPIARTARVEGTVILEADITESGTLENVKVIEGHPMLAAAAVDAVKHWRYAPAKLNGRPTRSSVTVTVHFRLNFQ
jgi:periplasmic protein TonB